MNTEKNINARLLRLYPVYAIKAHFEKTGHQGVVIADIVNTATKEQIKVVAQFEI